MRRDKFRPSQLSNCSAMLTKLATYNYCQKTTHHANRKMVFRSDYCTVVSFIVFLVSLPRTVSYQWTDFDDHMTSFMQECAFWGFCPYIFLLMGQIPKTVVLEAWIGIFKPHMRNNLTTILSKILHEFQPNFVCRETRPTALSSN